MKKIFFLFGVALCVLCNQTLLKAQSVKKPNILVILADDLGWSDLSCYGSKFYETPVLDQLAANGIRFTQNYTTSPVCSPTRASILTGKYPTKTGVTDWIKGRQENGKAKPYEKFIAQPTAYELALKENTIAEYALTNGYKTMHCGKWHLGETETFWPEQQGFQINKGGWSSGGPKKVINDTTGGFFTPYENPRLADGPVGEYLTDRLTNEALAFIEEQRQHPFLLYFSMYAVHNPMQAPTALVKKYQNKQKQLNLTANQRFAKDEPWMVHENGWRRRLVQDHPVYAAMVENMDWNIGRLLTKLKELGIDDNTLVIFTSDNGGLSTAEGSPTVNGPLKAGKGWLYEGGIRVPLIMYWKGKIVAGTQSDIPVNTNDIFSTVAKVMNQSFKQPAAVDGSNILKLLAKPQQAKQRTLYWYYPHYSNQGGRPGAAIREGKYKLIYHFEDTTTELYDVVNDISETKNLINSHSAIAKKMHAKLQLWMKKSQVKWPNPNPAYKPPIAP